MTRSHGYVGAEMTWADIPADIRSMVEEMSAVNERDPAMRRVQLFAAQIAMRERDKWLLAADRACIERRFRQAPLDPVQRKMQERAQE